MTICDAHRKWWTVHRQGNSGKTRRKGRCDDVLPKRWVDLPQKQVHCAASAAILPGNALDSAQGCVTLCNAMITLPHLLASKEDLLGSIAKCAVLHLLFSDAAQARWKGKCLANLLNSTGLYCHVSPYYAWLGAVKLPLQLEELLNLIHALVASCETLQMYPSYEKDGHPGEQSSSSLMPAQEKQNTKLKLHWKMNYQKTRRNHKCSKK